ncbi:unnamed protein product [Timema podura]|uniref:NADH dehydrogenase subunit 6 n=1 Tax=Timema podura TaxID=61482 RepID=A0ABN7PAJ4_TIMPD|nr:unnamed protein product [Timema podura]
MAMIVKMTMRRVWKMRKMRMMMMI